MKGVFKMSYSEYPHSSFPEKICDLPSMQDVSATMRPAIEQYNEAWINNDVDAMAAIKEKYPNLTKSLFNADKFNTLLDGLKATQKFFKEEVDGMIQDVAQKTVGINDSPAEDQKKLNSYSAEKTDYLTGVSIATNLSIPVAAWSSDLTYTFNSDKIEENDKVNVYFSSDSMVIAAKAFIVVKDETGAGNLVLQASKLPKSTLIIRDIEVVRKNG